MAFDPRAFATEIIKIVHEVFRPIEHEVETLRRRLDAVDADREALLELIADASKPQQPPRNPRHDFGL